MVFSMVAGRLKSVTGESESWCNGIDQMFIGRSWVRDIVSCVFSICDVISVGSQYIIDNGKAG